MPRPSNTSTRRLQIIKGMMRAMSEVGYQGATIPVIAEASGLTPGLIHYHFDSKQSILLALIEHLDQIVQKRFVARCKGTGLYDKLDAFIDAYVSRGQGEDLQAVSCWICIGAEAVREPEVRAAYRRVTREQLRRLQEICEEILPAKRLSARKKNAIALGIVSAIDGAFRLLVAAPELVVPGFASPTIKTMAHALIESQSVTAAS